MSVEEETELRDMVAQALELNGCLPKIRAELRANLFLCLDEDSKQNQQQPLINKKVKGLLANPEGRLMFCLVKEFLECLDLDFTMSVYDSESYLGSSYKYEGRTKIQAELGLPAKSNCTDPILLQLLQHNGHVEQNNNSNHKDSKVDNDDTFNGTSSIEEESVCASDKPKVAQKNATSKLDSSASAKETFSNSQSKDNKSSKTEQGSDLNTKEDYEEDFISGSDVELSLSKAEYPTPLLEELRQQDQTFVVNPFNNDGKSPEQNGLSQSD